MFVAKFWEGEKRERVCRYVFGKGVIWIESIDLVYFYLLTHFISNYRFFIISEIKMSFKASGVFPSNPVTTRGTSTKISSYKDKVVYTNGKTVIVRFFRVLGWFSGLLIYCVCVCDCCVDKRYERRCCSLDDGPYSFEFTPHFFFFFFFFFFSFSPFGFVLGEIAAFGGFDDVPRSCT